MSAACPRCGTELGPGLLACPSCRSLLHAHRLEELATQARAAEAEERLHDALEAWRDAHLLLPAGSRQHETIGQRIRELSDRAADGPAPAKPKPGGRRDGTGRLAALGAGALLLWKLKSVLAFVATKGKLLLAGLTQASTFFTMALSFGLYWTVFGWQFALLLVLSIYVHEMGHVAALRRHGIRAGEPAFIPGLGAVVRLKQYPATPREDASVGLAGPEWGLGAAVACWLVGLAGGGGVWLAAARIGAWINLFNLVPVWQLDGSRGFAALTRAQRLAVAAAFGLAWVIVHDGLLILLAIAALVRALSTPPAKPEDAHAPILWRFLFLIATLSALCLVEVPGMPGQAG